MEMSRRLQMKMVDVRLGEKEIYMATCGLWRQGSSDDKPVRYNGQYLVKNIWSLTFYGVKEAQ